MRFTHPNGNYEIVTMDGTQLIGEVETGNSLSRWVTIAHVGATGIIVDEAEWPAFMALVNEIDVVKKGM